MSIQLIKTGNSYNVPLHRFVCDTIEQRDALAASFGDHAIVAGKEYIKGTNAWYLAPGTAPDPYIPVDREAVDKVSMSRSGEHQGNLVFNEQLYLNATEIANTLLNYSLINETGNKIKFAFDTSNYKLKAQLYDKNNLLLSETEEIDLPLESLVDDVQYDDATKSLKIYLHNGTVRTIPLNALIDGYAKKDYVDTTFTKYVDFTALKNRVDLAEEAIEEKQDILVSEENIKTINEQNILGSGNLNVPTNAYNSIKQLDDYLFEVQYSTENIDYEYANDYFQSIDGQADVEGGACSGVIKNGKVLRQLDWYYDDGAEFVVRRTADQEKGLYASVAICSGIKDVSKSLVESGAYSKKFKMVPFIVTDGINEKGVYVQTNVVPQFYNDDTIVNYNLNSTSTEDCCISMMARYILDHCANLQEVHNAFNTLHIYSTAAMSYGFHFLVAQGNNWEIIELTNDGYVAYNSSNIHFPVMTNFRLGNGIITSEGEIAWENVEKYGIGLERYETAIQALIGTKTLEQLRTDLKYTNIYTDAAHTWKTEFSGEMGEDLDTHQMRKITVMDAKNGTINFAALFNAEAEKYASRTRADGKGTWQTTHSSIYDLNEKSLKICIQERMGTSRTITFSGEQTASEVLYNNSVSKITATNVQDAIDEALNNHFLYKAVSIPVSKWDSSNTTEIRVKGIKPNSDLSQLVFISPDFNSIQQFQTAQIVQYSEQADKIKLSCVNKPTQTINVTIAIINGGKPIEDAEASPIVGQGTVDNMIIE